MSLVNMVPGAAAPPQSPLEQRAEKAQKPATLGEWRAALLCAVRYLARGDFGHHVHRQETWEQALVRVAADVLAEHGLGRAAGDVDAEWIRSTWYIADRGSGTGDRMVQAFAPRGHAGSLRIAPSSLPHSPRDTEAC
jgi:hypothetical protein